MRIVRLYRRAVSEHALCCAETGCRLILRCRVLDTPETATIMDYSYNQNHNNTFIS